MTFLIGAGNPNKINPVDGERSWCMHEGTGKMTCPDCHAKGETDGIAAVERHVESVNRAAAR